MHSFDAKALKTFYERLQDEESRRIFSARLMYFLDGNEEHLWKMIDDIWQKGIFVPEVGELIAQQKSGKEIVLYGAGTLGAAAKTFFERHGLKVSLFCDKNAAKQQSGFMGVPVISLSDLINNHSTYVVVLTASQVYANEIKRELAANGNTAKVFDFFVHYEFQGYFEHDFLKPVANEIYLDCGVLNGSDIRAFMGFSGQNHTKIYGFEPDAGSYKRALENLHGIPGVELINKGVWSSAATLSFSQQSDGVSHISDGGLAKITVTTIDETVGTENVTFIKMDVEGAELEALKGATQTLTRCKPRLAISIYHKPEDILEVSLYIHALVPDYKYYLRHHEVGTSGIVLFALPECAR